MLFTKIGSSYSASKFPKAFSNQLYFSENVDLGEYTYQSSYSIKYVLSGYETYAVDGREMRIQPNQHLLVNNHSKVTTLPAQGKAISIFIAPETLSDVKSINECRTLENILDNFNTHEETPLVLFEKVYGNENPKLNKIIHQFVSILLNNNISGEHEADPSVFFNLAEAILADQQVHSSRMDNLNNIKNSTTQEQYNRLLLGYQYLNDNWNQPFSLKKTASISLLSPYHFHRLFQACFFKTPYKYHLDIQMEKAVDLLKKRQYSINEISLMLGFNSSTAFGRVFKKYYGTSPTLFMK